VFVAHRELPLPSHRHYGIGSYHIGTFCLQGLLLLLSQSSQSHFDGPAVILHLKQFGLGRVWVGATIGFGVPGLHLRPKRAGSGFYLTRHVPMD